MGCHFIWLIQKDRKIAKNEREKKKQREKILFLSSKWLRLSTDASINRYQQILQLIFLSVNFYKLSFNFLYYKYILIGG